MIRDTREIVCEGLQARNDLLLAASIFPKFNYSNILSKKGECLVCGVWMVKNVRIWPSEVEGGRQKIKMKGKSSQQSQQQNGHTHTHTTEAS